MNRTASGKTGTFILDFANKAEDIQEAFKPYFDATELSEPIDVNMVYDMQQRIRAKYLYNDSDINKFIKIYYDETVDESILEKILAAAPPFVAGDLAKA